MIWTLTASYAFSILYISEGHDISSLNSDDLSFYAKLQCSFSWKKKVKMQCRVKWYGSIENTNGSELF